MRMSVLGSGGGNIPYPTIKIDLTLGHSGNFAKPLASNETQFDYPSYIIRQLRQGLPQRPNLIVC
jgi:hypothetical protein